MVSRSPTDEDGGEVCLGQKRCHVNVTGETECSLNVEMLKEEKEFQYCQRITQQVWHRKGQRRQRDKGDKDLSYPVL